MDKKSLFYNLLLFVFSTMLSLLVLELLFRFFLFGNDSFSIEKMNSVHAIGVSGLIKPSFHHEIIYELKPNLDTYFKLALFRTNSRGLRDKEYEIVKPKHTFRTATIGDSFTMPAGVKIEKAYHSLLEEKLNKEQKKLNYEFINFGVGGYSLRQYWGVIKYKAQEYTPDLIIIGFCPANDHLIPPPLIYAKLAEGKYKVKTKTYPFFNSFVADTIAGMLRKLKRKFLETNNTNKLKTGTVFSEQQKNYMLDYFSKISNFSKDNNVPVIIANLSNRYNETYVKVLKKLVIESDLNFVDTSLPFKGADLNKYKIYPIDSHPNEAANQIFAEEIYNYLTENRFLSK